MAATLEQSGFSSGGSYTFDGTGSNRAIIIFAYNRDNSTSKLTSLTINSVEPDQRIDALREIDGGRSCTMAVGIWLDGNVPGTGSYTIASTWDTTQDIVYTVVEVKDALQNAFHLCSEMVSDKSNSDAYNVQFTVSRDVVGEAGELGICSYGCTATSASTVPTTADTNTNLDGQSDDTFGSVVTHTGFGYDTSIASATQNFGLDITGTQSGVNVDSTTFVACAVRGSDWTLPDGPTIESIGTNYLMSASTTISVVAPQTVDSGDILLFLVGNDDTSGTANYDDSTLKPDGFTLIKALSASEGNSRDTHNAAFYKVAAGTEGGDTITCTCVASELQSAYIVRISGADMDSGEDALGTESSGGTIGSGNNPITIPAATAVDSDVLAIGILSSDGSDMQNYSTSSTGWSFAPIITSAPSSVRTHFAFAWKAVSSGSTGTLAVDSDSAGADGAAGFIFTIAPAAASAFPYHSIKQQRKQMKVLLTR